MAKKLINDNDIVPAQPQFFIFHSGWNFRNTNKTPEESSRNNIMSAYHLYGNFGEKFPSNDTGIFFGTEIWERD